MAQRYILLLKEQCFLGKNYITCHYHRITCLYSAITPCYPATMACYQITGLIPRISLAPHALIARGLWAYRFCPLSDKQAGLLLIARQPLGYRTFSKFSTTQLVVTITTLPVAIESVVMKFTSIVVGITSAVISGTNKPGTLLPCSCLNQQLPMHFLQEGFATLFW